MNHAELLNAVSVLYHSSIRIAGSRTVYADPFEVEGEPHDADLILITHDHYDHFSPEDLQKVRRDDTVMALPKSALPKALELGFPRERIVALSPGDRLEAAGLPVEAVAAYNREKAFHPQKNGWVGYLLTLDGVRYFIAGDTDMTPENQGVRCDVALVPVGGTYTMDAAEAARLVNAIRPKAAVPTHYAAIVGSREDAKRFGSLLDPGIAWEERMMRTKL